MWLSVLVPLACTPGSPGTSDASTTNGSITSVSDTNPTTTTDAIPTTSNPSEPSSTDGPEPPCSDGDARCDGHDAREVCQDGEWVEENCNSNEGCASAGACEPCTCNASTCKDPSTLNRCDCFELVEQPCPLASTCTELAGEVACHPQVCTPGVQECVGTGAVKTCSPDGTMFLPEVACDGTELCDDGQCTSACGVVAKNHSSTGCEFWAVDMANVPPSDGFAFGVALSNPSQQQPAEIKIYDRNNNGNEQLLLEGTIQPRDVETFILSGSGNGLEGHYTDDAGFIGTGIAKGRAFRIDSTMPIVATQFNPLGGAVAFTTDASLLLPTHALGTSYYHMAWDRGLGSGSAMVIVATEDNTVINLNSKADTPAGQNGMPAVTAGAEIVLPAIGRYDYIQLAAANQDLSASKIEASAPVAVFGGHSCGRVPNDQIDFCDHIEEQIFPIDTWGSHYVVARSPARNTEPMLWRLIAAADGTNITFSPPVSIGPSSNNLSAGQMIQFTAHGDFEIRSNAATKPVLVAGYTYGCKAAQFDTCPGDPSMVLAVPVEQWLSDYVFLVDFSYSNDNIRLVRSTGQPVEVGCFGVIEDWTPVTDGYESAILNINPGVKDCQPGVNTATSASPFSIMVVGEAASTSYAYPGGMALRPINPG